MGLRIIDEEGLDALSMRRLAEELGVGKMTLYGYFRTKDELLEQVILRVLAEVPVESAAGLPWDQRLLSVVDGFHGVLCRHPGALSLMFARPSPSPAPDRVRETILDILATAGFSVLDAVDAHTTLLCYAMGYAHMERARLTADPTREAARLRGLEPAAFPRLTTAASVYSTHLSEQGFRSGLQTVIDGMKVKVQR